MKERAGRIFRLVTVLSTIILVFLIVTGCVDFGKAWGAITGLFGTAGAGIRQNIDTAIKALLLIAITATITAIIVHKIEKK